MTLPVTEKSLATTEAPLALGTEHDGTFFCCSGQSLCQTLFTLNWLLVLLTVRTTQKTVDLSSGLRMPINTHCWLHLPRTCCQLQHLRHT